MIIEKVKGRLKDTDVHGRSIVYVDIEWFEKDKKLLRKTASDGTEVGIRLQVSMADGDILYEDAEKLMVVRILPTELIHIDVFSMREMGRLCFEIGNRHLSVSIRDSFAEIPYDAPTFEYLQKLGFKAEKIQGIFDHFTVCHAHGDHNHHTHDREK